MTKIVIDEHSPSEEKQKQKGSNVGDIENAGSSSTSSNTNDKKSKATYRFERTHVVEQRVSNLAQGLLTLVAMSPPLLVVLHLVPQAVLAGLFFIMGYQALEGNGITVKLLFLLRDSSLTGSGPSAAIDEPLLRIERRSAVWAFVGIELVGFAATFAITQTVAAVGFPVFILALIPVRAAVMPLWFREEELAALDAMTASEMVMENVGGTASSKGQKARGRDVEEGGEASGRNIGDVVGGSEGGLRERGNGRRDADGVDEEEKDLGHGKNA